MKWPNRFCNFPGIAVDGGENTNPDPLKRLHVASPAVYFLSRIYTEHKKHKPKQHLFIV